jgi:large subunit ribosomal protein L25
VFLFFCRHSEEIAKMADSVVLVTEKREGRGGHKAAKLRKAGKVPAVIYGHKEETISVSVSHDILLAAIKHATRVVDIDVQGKVEKAQIAEVQWDVLGKDVIHVDLKRVSADERIKVKVPVELRGVAPGAQGGLGVLDQPLHDLEIECGVLNIPETIRVAINELQMGSAIHVKELKLPEGIKVLADPDAIVVQVIAPKLEPEPGTVLAGGLEPEVITARKPKEEDGDDKK